MPFSLRIEDNMPPSPSPSPDFQTSQWNPWTIAFIATICSIFLVLSCHRILHRYCCAFQLTTWSRNQDQRRGLNDDNADDPSQQFQSQGLDSYIAQSLPVVQYKEKNEADIYGINTDCAVCLGEFEGGEWIKHLPNCSHVFHVSCIDIWFQTHSSCPLCRADIFDLEYAYTLQETPTGDEVHEERSSLYEMLRSHVLQSYSFRLQRNHEN